MIINKNSGCIKLTEYDGGRRWYDYESKIETDEDIIIEMDGEICFKHGVSTKRKIKSNVSIISNKHIIAGDGIEVDGDIYAYGFLWADGGVVKATGDVDAKYFDVNCGIEVGGYINGGANYVTYGWSFDDGFPKKGETK